MAALNPGIDEREARAIERRRQLEEERKQRIFNPRARRMGVDKAALDEQIRLKREREEEERKREELYARQQERVQRQLALLEQQQADMRREERKELERFRLQAQQYGARVEFDLNDPDALKKERSADKVESVSAGQKFLGEDRGFDTRKKRQQEQMRRWCEEELAAKDYKARQEAEAQRLHELRMAELNQRQKEMEEAEAATRRAVAAADRAYNERMAAEARERRRQRKLEELNENLEEINNNLNSDLLNENPERGRHSMLGEHRVVPTEYKGMSPEEIRQIREDQLRQQREAEEKRRQEEEEEARWARQQEANRRAGVLAEQQQQNARRQMNARVRADNTTLAAEFQRKQERWNAEATTNVPGDGYWNKFNTSTR